MFIDAMKIINNNYKNGYTIPSEKLYPFQWNWDSAFSSLAIHSFNKEKAWVEINSLFSGQWFNGMIPHIIFHQKNNNYFPGEDFWNHKGKSKKPTTCITQPPVIISVVYWLTNIGDEYDLEQAKLLYHQLFKYLKWFNDERDIDNLGLIKIIHPWETGRDNSPDWDEAMKNIKIKIDENIIKKKRKDIKLINQTQRPTNDDYYKFITLVDFGNKNNWNKIMLYYNCPFQVVDHGIQFIYIRACKDFLKLSNKLNIHDYDNIINSWIQKFTLGSEKLWCPKLKSYCSYNFKTHKLTTNISCCAFLSFYADIGSIKQKNDIMVNICNFMNNNKYCFPSWNNKSKSFNPVKYWRGPVWAIINLLISIGLYKDYQLISQKILDNTKELIQQNGFYEYFNPETGKGCGGNNFTWTASVYIITLNIQKYANIFYN